MILRASPTSTGAPKSCCECGKVRAGCRAVTKRCVYIASAILALDTGTRLRLAGPSINGRASFACAPMATRTRTITLLTSELETERLIDWVCMDCWRLFRYDTHMLAPGRVSA